MLPPLPTVPVCARLKIPPGDDVPLLPTISIAPVTFRLTFPASPRPAGWVLDALPVWVSRLAPSVSDK